MFTGTDMFCGGGGSTTGAHDAGGVEIKIALNHWAPAINTHSANYPNTFHDQADISKVSPKRYPRTDFMLASPECTKHTTAQGKKRPSNQPALFGDEIEDESAEKSRATMYDVPRFAEAHNYEFIILENVVEAYEWLPFQGWLMSMESLGYDHDIVCVNSMHASIYGQAAPQSRDRMYIVFWKKGNRKPDLERLRRPRAFCAPCGQMVEAQQWWKNQYHRVGEYGKQYLYRCPNDACGKSLVEPYHPTAASFIDFTDLGNRIGDRKRPLVPNTMNQIREAMSKYWSDLTVPADPLTMAYYGTGHNARTIHQPLSTLTTVERHALLVPGDPADPMDIKFRMLKTMESKKAMAFPEGYILTGNKREQHMQLGNAVCPPNMRDLVTVAVESLL